MMSDALDAQNVVAYLTARGFTLGAGVTARQLGGGVSNVVLAVSEGPGSMVVKQALPRLRVADEWPAPRERAMAEADALDLVRRLTPGAAPRLLDRDPDRCVLVVEQAPASWEDWKSLLLSGKVDQQIAATLGSILSTWHNATVHGSTLSERFHEVESFEALRVDPFYRTVARRMPGSSRRILEYVDEMLARRICLVHGDFSPKNVLVSPDSRLWIIDYEVAHLGDPAFDLAFLLCHLTLKSVHRPELAPAYDRCAAEFTSAYEVQARPELSPSWPYVLGHVGCLLLARVCGKSPAGYLSNDGQACVRRLGEILISEPPARQEDLAEARRLACT